jgi:hypothetical protein
MSDHDAMPDPIDDAYAQAKALLADEDARAVRRARVLTAVANQLKAAPAVKKPPISQPAWRWGAGMAAAAIGGLSVLIATRFDQPGSIVTTPAAELGAEVPNGAPTPPSPPNSVAPAAPETSAPAVRADRRGESFVAGSRPHDRTPPAPLPANRAPAPPGGPPFATPDVTSVPPLPVPPVEHRIEQPEPPKAPPPEPGTVAAARLSGSTPAPPAAPPRAFPAAESARPEAGGEQAARLRAAAAAGRLDEVTALLAQGASIDGADLDGETALMKSIKADYVEVAAFLRSRGASLDRQNKAGVSAREMAALKRDPRLNEALDLRH